MGLFNRKNKGKGSRSQELIEPENLQSVPTGSQTESAPDNKSGGKKKKERRSSFLKRGKSKRTVENGDSVASPEPKSPQSTGSPSSPSSVNRSDPSTPSWEMVPKLIHDLETAKTTSGDKPARALRMLFALSEHSTTGTEHRTKMVRVENQRLVPVLLEYLRRCERGSSEQYLCLLVLNNVSIPSENKRLIAVDCGGATVFARLLCEDPSCHLLAIILVNITFADADLRRELVSGSAELMESLAYALRVSSLTMEEYEARQPLVVADEDGKYSPRDLLIALIEEDRRLRPSPHEYNFDGDEAIPASDGLMDPSRQLYPETARWCLSAIKNLTRPSMKESPAATILIDTCVVPLIMRFITVSKPTFEGKENQASASLSESPSAVDTTKVDPKDLVNSPTKWDSNSSQDAALFVVLNLAASNAARDFIRDIDGIPILSGIAECGKEIPDHLETEEIKQLEFQCLKARMALSYLVGSEGHFGQPKGTGSGISKSERLDSVIVLTETEVELMIELLGNTIHGKAKDGPGGYSAATFNTKWVLLALRCLLTNTLNQVRFVNVGGAALNSLLMKSLALHTLQNSSTIDSDAAEHAVFCLYLQSTYGFKKRFLPSIFDNKDNISGKGSLAAQILTSYRSVDDVPPAGKHAVEQLLLRLRYLNFSGSMMELVSPTGGGPTLSDFELGPDLMIMASGVVVGKRVHGARPKEVIFDRPILRSRAPKKGNNNAPWDNQAMVSVYPSALHATQALSFGSTKVKHMDAIDDIAIANNIANSANGQKTESYNYWWTWQDASSAIQKNLDRQRSYDSGSLFSSKSKVKKSNADNDGPMTIFGLRCGPCA